MKQETIKKFLKPVMYFSLEPKRTQEDLFNRQKELKELKKG